MTKRILFAFALTVMALIGASHYVLSVQAAGHKAHAEVYQYIANTGADK